MTITVTKPKQVEKAKEQALLVDATGATLSPEEMDYEQLADLYGSLEDQIEALKTNPIYTQFDLVKKALVTKINAEVEAADIAEIKGEHWLLEIGACGKNPRKVKDVGLIQTFVGQEVFAQIAKVNITDVEKYLTPDQVAKVLDSDTGYSANRKITAKFLG